MKTFTIEEEQKIMNSMRSRHYSEKELKILNSRRRTHTINDINKI
jgi:hypothetical protein